MNLLLSLNKALSVWPKREAVVDGPVRLTYAQLGARITALACALQERQVKPGSVTAILSPNNHQFLESYYACALLAAVLAPLNFRLAPREICAIALDAQAKVLIAHTDFCAEVEAVMKNAPTIEHVIWIGSGSTPLLTVPSSNYEKDIDEHTGSRLSPAATTAQDLAQLYYTSGTTGKAKGVMLTHGNVSWHALAAIAELNLTDGDKWIHAAPMFHLADAWATFAITWVGGKHLFLPYFKASEVLKLIQSERATITNLIPVMLNQMVHESQSNPHDYSSLRMILSGGAPIAPQTVRQIISTFGCEYVQTYGMTETSPYLTLSLLKSHLKQLPENEQLAIRSRTGRSFAAVELKVVRSDGTAVCQDDKEVGEIIVKGPTVTPGYWNQPQATAQAVRDGWLHTGDLATIDSEGYVNIVDRKKDMIITGGENVYSTEVEHILYEHPSVLECAVIGVPDSAWGEAVKAIVVPKPGHEIDDRALIEFTRQYLAHYKCPKTIEFASELPRTGSGKIYKKALRDKYAGNAAQTAM